MLLATQISNDANSKLTYVGLAFFVLGILSVMAPFAVTDDFIAGTVKNYDFGTPWAGIARTTFRQTSESPSGIIPLLCLAFAT